MAFVYQAERELGIRGNDVPANVGPGSYVGHSQYKLKQSAAPFNTQVTRGKPLKKDQSPGPGSYNVDFMTEGQKVVLQSAQSEVKILEIPRQQSVFVSKSKRFNEKNIIETPGPGAYDSQVQIRPIQQQYTSQNYIQDLMKLNRYQSIPSIPANNQIYGYTEKGSNIILLLDNDLELNKSPQEQYTGLKSDTVGPGQYQLKDTFEINKNKGANWCKSKVPKLAPTVNKDKELIVGPGAYDHESAMIPLYKLNPSGAFLSKSQRMFDLQKGQRAREFMRVQFEQQKRKLMQNPAFSDIDEEEIEFIEDATPGPGHYFSNTSMSTASHYSQSMPRIGGKSAFGSKQKRFKEQEVANQIGPGDYDVHANLLRPSVPYKQPPFLSSNTRFESKVLEKKPGPQTYNPKVSLEDQLIKKLERAPVGKFGSNQPRFYENENEVPGPGTYDELKKETELSAACVFKSQSKRDTIQVSAKNVYPAPGAYDVKNYTIEQATKVEKEEDPDLAVKKPGFGSSMPRFGVKQIDEEDEDEAQIIQQNSSDLFKKMKKDAPAFNSQERRFQYENKNPVPGPGEYHDPKQNAWDKKTFNILFSEI